MKSIKEINEGEKYLKGLHQAKVGDYISVGIEGYRNREKVKISKVLDTDKLVDQNGNIFSRNGIIIRRKGGWAKFYGKGKIVSAKIVTQKEFDEEYKKIKVEFIINTVRDLDIETLEKMIDIIPNMSQANNKRISRFE